MSNNLKLKVSSKQLEEITKELLAMLDARSRDIILARYGMKSGKVETLESIGREYGITRERVRQIENQAKGNLAKREDLSRPIAEDLETVFSVFGGTLHEDHVIEALNKEKDEPLKKVHVILYMDILSPYEYVTKDPEFEPHWSHKDINYDHINDTVSKIKEILKATKEPQKEEKLYADLMEKLDVNEDIFPYAYMEALLRVGKKLKKTVFGEWALSEWVEATPRGVGDKAYVILKRGGKPKHFREITTIINEAGFDHKNAHVQTVHNELIKDDRFVLVGRGMYGLTEWGFMPGTVSQVLEAILSKENRPMTKEEILDKVLEQRLVKKTTVLLGLQNSNRFERVDGDRYYLKELKS